MKILSCVLFILLPCSCTTYQYHVPKSTVETDLFLVNQTVEETDRAVDILFDESLSIEERTELYLKRMGEINERWDKE